MTRKAPRILIERIKARVFCHGPGGGNPVTVFSTSSPLSSSTKEYLAKECDWESVMVSSSSSTSEKQDQSSSKLMSFYMPSGQEVSFCAHAALGGAIASAKEEEELSFRSTFVAESHDAKKQKHTVHLIRENKNEKNDEVQMACLNMTVPFDSHKVSHPPGLQRLLREHLGILSNQISVTQGKKYPTFMNASVARPKTLVHVNSFNALEMAKTPKVLDENKRFSFASACDSIDRSTGIYIYTNKEQEVSDDESLSWECRQFPRASGYPEDPATGIAAAALASAIFKSGVYTPVYKFFQGTTMGRPSLIEVVNMKETVQEEDGATMVSFGLQGKVEIDERETIEVENKD